MNKFVCVLLIGGSLLANKAFAFFAERARDNGWKIINMQAGHNP
ncbi:hypothetical protein [Parapedobacter tibetensis]|nr:hypothetical protein [Parapedobacter tibetensis]